MSYTRYDFSNTGENQTSRLVPHPLNEKVYGHVEPDADLQKSVNEYGIFNPIIINRKKQILSGTRRWMAAKAAGYAKVPTLVLRNGDQDEPLIEELFLIESNRTRTKTKGQIAREAHELKRIETALAKERQKHGKERLPDPAQAGQARDKVAKTLGVSGPTVDKMDVIVEKANAGDPQAQEALAKLDRNETSVVAAYQVLKPTAPKRDLTADKKMAEALSKHLTSSGLDACVNHMSKTEGHYSVTLKGLTELQVRQLPTILKNLLAEEDPTFAALENIS